MDDEPRIDEEAEMIESATSRELVVGEGDVISEPCIGMEFDSEEAAKVFYDAYATRMGFVMRADRRSLRDGKIICRRLVCNKEGFRRDRRTNTNNRKPRVVTREGCKAMIMVKQDKSGKWVVSKFEEEHNHPLVITSGTNRRNWLRNQTPVSSLNLKRKNLLFG